ncbi:Hypothetical predicted protein [Paramuricea clavata]|uniref:Uncharacterized protein n=1 Tax=Paramuricea clavata TaxID=317549 RepID=A0A7D9EQV0_PARCT|nr:Hypothetical predicted protein [Paramuricea clavata]
MVTRIKVLNIDESEEGSNSAAVASSITTPTPMSAVNNIPRSGLPPFAQFIRTASSKSCRRMEEMVSKIRKSVD